MNIVKKWKMSCFYFYITFYSLIDLLWLKYSELFTHNVKRENSTILFYTFFWFISLPKKQYLKKCFVSSPLMNFLKA